MRKTIVALCLLSMVFCEGCGTLATHGKWPADSKDPDSYEPSSGVYRGVRWDYKNDKDFGKSFGEAFVHGGGGGQGSEYVVAVAVSLLVVDHAFSAIGDTVMLPHDLKNENNCKTKRENPTADTSKSSNQDTALGNR